MTDLKLRNIKKYMKFPAECQSQKDIIDKKVKDLLYFNRMEIENILTKKNVLNINDLKSYLSDWVKCACFNKKEILYVYKSWLEDYPEDKEKIERYLNWVDNWEEEMKFI